MTLKQITNLLRQSGVNSKKQVIDMIENASLHELQELRRDVETTIAVKIAAAGRKNGKR